MSPMCFTNVSQNDSGKTGWVKDWDYKDDLD